MELGSCKLGELLGRASFISPQCPIYHLWFDFQLLIRIERITRPVHQRQVPQSCWNGALEQYLLLVDRCYPGYHDPVEFLEHSSCGYHGYPKYLQPEFQYSLDTIRLGDLSKRGCSIAWIPLDGHDRTTHGLPLGISDVVCHVVGVSQRLLRSTRMMKR